MEQWGNWSGKVTARPTVIRQLRSADDAAATAATAAAAGTTVRCVGAAHSHSPLVPTDHTIVDLSALSGVTTLDHDRLRARVRSGTTINTLGVALHAAGLSLHNQGDIDRQTIAGATATGTSPASSPAAARRPSTRGHWSSATSNEWRGTPNPRRVSRTQIPSATEIVSPAALRVRRERKGSSRGSSIDVTRSVRGLTDRPARGSR